MSKRDEDRKKWFAARQAQEWGLSPEAAQAEIERRRTARATAMARNTQPEPQSPPEPPSDAVGRVKSDLKRSPQKPQDDQDDQAGLIAYDWGRRLPFGVQNGRDPMFERPPRPPKPANACPDCYSGYRAPSCTGYCCTPQTERYPDPPPRRRDED